MMRSIMQENITLHGFRIFSEFDGILLDLCHRVPARPDCRDTEREVLNIPAISLLEQIPGLYHSGIDNYEAISRIVEHLTQSMDAA